MRVPAPHAIIFPRTQAGIMVSLSLKSMHTQLRGSSGIGFNVPLLRIW